MGDHGRPDGHELEELEEKIEDVSERLEEERSGGDGQQRWIESGSIRPDLDDPAIAPPG